ncbi:hypothetical protein Taro_047325 [Colocasia esculenta]|uniref:Uncharacterized protein n=1 Tax=Colocasia esculenta TaxID=4460 RepID=A0A843X6K2_COLES|nr:hypothetical protein [Colocasia esculenta]
MPTVVTSPVGFPRFFVSQAISSGLCPDTCVVPSRSVSSDLDTLTPVFELYVQLRERQYRQTVRARRTFHDRRPVQSRAVEVQGRYLQLCSSSSSSVLYLGVCPRLLCFFSVLWKYGYVTCDIYIKCSVFLCVYTDCGLVSLARLRPVRGRQTRIKYVIGLMGLAEAFRHSWYQSKAPVPPVAVPPGDGETVPVAPVPPRVEVPFVAPVPPPPPVLLAEEPVMQVEKFLRLQPPTYSGGPNPDTVEHWVHEIERVFATMRCPAADKVVLAAYQLRGFALEWWRLKM